MSSIPRFELFCKDCLACELFFGIGKDSCPECGCKELVNFGKLTFVQQALAVKRYEEEWKKKWNPIKEN